MHSIFKTKIHYVSSLNNHFPSEEVYEIAAGKLKIYKTTQ